MSAIKIESYPNNEIRITKLPLYSPGRPSRKNEGLFNGQVEVIPTSEETVAPPPLDITSELETVEPKPGYGSQSRPTRFGVVGRRTLIRAGAALTKSIEDPRHVVFLTGTLPGSTRESFSAIARYSSFIVHRLKAWVAKRCKSKLDMYCWEWQKRGALHLHYAVHCPDHEARQYIINQFKSQWIRLIDAISEKSGVDCWRKDESYTHAINKEVVQADARECEKDIGRYLSKYISKQQKQSSDKQFYPTRWWGISRPLNELLKSLSEVIMIPLSSEWRYRRIGEELRQFVDINEMRVQEYSVEQFAQVTICYTKPEEHEGLWENVKRRITQICPKVITLSIAGSTTRETMRLETENLSNSVRSVYALIQRQSKLQTLLQDVLSSQEREVLSFIIDFQYQPPRNVLVCSVRLLSVLAMDQYVPRKYSHEEKMLALFDQRFNALIQKFPKGQPIPDRLENVAR